MRYPTILHRHTAMASLFAVTALMSSHLLAAGYAVKEVSASLLGTAFAGGATSAIDASTIHFNPANLGLLEGNQIYIAATGIFADVDVTHAQAGLFGFVPVFGDANQNNVAKSVAVPAAYFVWDATERVNFGLAVNSPFGLKTNYDDDWVGRFHGIDSELESVNLNPMVSYHLNDQWSLAAGFQAQYLNAKLSNAFVDPILLGLFGTIAEGNARVKGHGWGYGYNLGTIFELTEQTRFGLSYTSRLHTTLKGDVHASDDVPFGAFLNGTDASATVETPDRVNFGVYHDFTPCFTLMADVQWTHWSLFKDLTVKFTDVDIDSVTPEHWKNTWFATVGGEARPLEKWSFRGGLAWDQSPVKSNYRTPRIPDNDRWWVTAGASYHFTDCLRGDLGYAYLYAKDSTINLEGVGDDLPLGSLEADVNAHVNLVSVGLNFLF